MTKKTIQLSESEKALFKKTFRIRLWLGLFIAIPFFATLCFVTYQYLIYYIDLLSGKIIFRDKDFESFILIFFLICCWVIVFFYAIPFYVKTIKMIGQTHKTVATTQISDIIIKYRSQNIKTYQIVTDYITIDTYFTNFLNPVRINDLQIGMSIEIHHLENNYSDIIKIVILKN